MRTILLTALALSTIAVTAASAQSVRNQARTPAAYTVINQGKVVGADPDPYVRFELLREGDPANANG